ncbi:insulinase family protein [Thiorhodococcus mannitoliphagus]|uniref:Insulinase family protein n=1 Tax=Thiorhodococcus mannitoliphagus TaxID=329406 RepID=A0A6P1DQQ0_9GAMM|nr:pitrilysin family protein [Thiorhodococcus mannitoliphagus]NEX19261.1 insulinase family protein [Thiorhodococcus mannitoliphagus]
MKRRLIAALLCLLPLAAGASSKVYEHTLDNGLKILVKPNHRAPILTSQVWYRIGSSYEYGGITGVSHVLEHMMFKGTESLKPGEFSRIVAENGGEENAFTGRDFTAYYQNLAKDRLEVSFKLESDRMRHLALQEEEFLKELEVVKEERRMRTDDDPQSLTYERFNAVAFEASPYRNPVIGWASDLDQLKLEDLKDWYRLWYAPNNAILVVAGDVEPDAVFALAETYFGPLAAENIRAPKTRGEPEQRGEKRLRVEAPAKESYLLMGYKTPSVGDTADAWEPYALEILSSILDGGDSSRFSRDLIRGEQVAASAGASYSVFQRLPGLFLFEGVPAAGHSIEDVEQAIRAQIARVQSAPVSQSELQRVRNQVVAAKVYERDSLFYQAMMLGQLETLGLDWQLSETYVDALAAVTPEQVQAVAKKYLTPDHLTVAVLDPQPIEQAQPASANSGAGEQANAL